MPDSATPPALNPRRNLAREVLLSLRAEIISGQLQPGDALASGKPELAAEKMALHIESSMEWTPSETSTAEHPPKLATAISRR